jgi:hypothetical protein
MEASIRVGALKYNATGLEYLPKDNFQLPVGDCQRASTQLLIIHRILLRKYINSASMQRFGLYSDVTVKRAVTVVNIVNATFCK